jgi:prophage regulatory protein
VSGTGSALQALKIGLPGLGLYLSRKGRMVYAVEYFKGGALVTKVIGTVNKISVDKARRLAAKLLSDPQITPKRQPAPTQTPSAGVTRGAESNVPNDRTRQPQTKVRDLKSAPEKVRRKLVTFDELKETYGIPYGRKQLARLEAAGDFPKRVPISNARIGWIESEIEGYLEQRISKRAVGSLYNQKWSKAGPEK